ncbi:lysophospholipid acyltransferase family protein [Singulisphaera sp. PoT]|uniref:lysophospholipid acyltransferase family protein n=1 Tax=Singulisphaera sp. PoT TaxID=3411797 RepID=UPI003BF4A46C
MKESSAVAEKAEKKSGSAVADRSRLAIYWYRIVQIVVATALYSLGGIRASGRNNLPTKGGALLVSNHASHLDVFILGIPLHRPLNYVARSTLFFPPLGTLIRSVGGFPIQREGMGAQGLKETLKRLKSGGIVALFPEGTRTKNGEIGEFKSGIAVLAARAKVPIIPAAVAGTFEAWPRSRMFPKAAPVSIHYGTPITPEELSQLDGDAMTDLIRVRVLQCQEQARCSLATIRK